MSKYVSYESWEKDFFTIPNIEELEDILNYFENTEEYEYCAELKELIEGKKYFAIDLFLEELAEKNGITLQ